LKRFSLVLAIAALGAMCVASTALASHARPISATPLSFAMVPSFKPATPCAGTVTTHGLPLNLTSCNPPVQTSSFLTAQAPDRPAPFTGPADAQGRIVLSVKCVTFGTTTVVAAAPPCAGTPTQDVLIEATAAGVRCQVVIAGGVCTAPNAPYNGKVLGVSQIQITDHDNTAGGVAGSPCPAGGGVEPNCAGTVTPLPFSVGSQCTAGSCNYTTTANLALPVAPYPVKEGKRGVVELGQIQVQDAGSDGNLLGGAGCPPTCAQTPTDGFATAYVQGLFLP